MLSTESISSQRSRAALFSPLFMKEPVHVVCACNANYIMPLCVMLASLVDHFDPERDLVIHIISNDATAQIRENVRESIRMNRPGLEHIEIRWLSLDPALINGLVISPGSHISADTYTRIFAPLILPEDCERILYLDCDMVVLADVSKLFDLADGSKRVLHAASDVGTPWVSSVVGVFDYAERNIPANKPYFNAGVLVINLQLWRERNLTAEILDYVVQHGERIFFEDQGALNAILHDDWTPLDNRWNQGNAVLMEEWWMSMGYSREEWLRVRNHPYIIHFTSAKKPWQPGRRTPRYSYFFKYLQRTVYKDSIKRRPYLENIVGIRIYYHLWKWARRVRNLIKPEKN
jgi:lipopolysaccharide biosynthesis glycosyltransferase